MVPWCHGAMVPWHLGTMVQWFPGARAPWCHGTMVPRYLGAMEPWKDSTMLPWNHGTMAPWYHGTMVPVQPGSGSTRFVINPVPVHVRFTVHAGSFRRGSGSCRFGSDGRFSWFRFPAGSVSGSRVDSQASCERAPLIPRHHPMR